MAINVFVCGRFHYHHYVKYLGKSLKKIYFSHKLTETMGVSKNFRENHFFKEYFLGLHLKIFGRRWLGYPMRLYQLIWKAGVCINLKVAPINLVMLHGNSASIIKILKKSGACVWGEAVNMHPVALEDIIKAESTFLNIETTGNNLQLKEHLVEISLIDFLLCPSEAVRQSYISNGFPEERSYVIPYGSEVSDKDSFIRKVSRGGLNNKCSAISIICVGQISIRKGQYRLLQAVKKLCDMGFDVDLTLVGKADPDYLDVLLKFGVDFKHIDHLNHSNVRIEMAKNSVFALFSIEDGFGMVVTEALEAGVPVVVSQYAGASEVIKNIGGGLVVDPFDVSAASDAILRCFRGDYPPLTGVPLTWEAYGRRVSELLESNV